MDRPWWDLGTLSCIRTLIFLEWYPGDLFYQSEITAGNDIWDGFLKIFTGDVQNIIVICSIDIIVLSNNLGCIHGGANEWQSLDPCALELHHLNKNYDATIALSIVLATVAVLTVLLKCLVQEVLQSPKMGKHPSEHSLHWVRRIITKCLLTTRIYVRFCQTLSKTYAWWGYEIIFPPKFMPLTWRICTTVAYS